jgi:hypothetical protein
MTRRHFFNKLSKPSYDLTRQDHRGTEQGVAFRCLVERNQTEIITFSVIAS